MTTKADASMSPYERYEDELVTLLQMPGVDVKPLPKIEALELPRQTEKPQIFVLVNGTEFAEREELAVVAQLGTVQCELFIRAKNPGGENWVFLMFTRRRNPVFWGIGCWVRKHPIYFNSFGYVSGLHNYWQYALTFSFAAYTVEADRPDSVPTIKEIKTNLLKNEKYEVVSPYVVFSVKAGAGRKEYALKKDDAVELPENDIAVRAMVARRQIKEVAATTVEPADSKKK